MTRIERGRAFRLLEVWASVKHHQAAESAKLRVFKPKQGPGDKPHFEAVGREETVGGDYRTVPTLEAVSDWSLCGFDSTDVDGAESIVRRTSTAVFRDRGLAPVLATAVEVDLAFPSAESKLVCYLLHPVGGLYGCAKAPGDAVKALRAAQVFPEALQGREGTREVMRLHREAMEAVARLNLADCALVKDVQPMTARMVRAKMTLNRDHRQPYNENIQRF